jgi:hypothetical protein
MSMYRWEQLEWEHIVETWKGTVVVRDQDVAVHVFVRDLGKKGQGHARKRETHRPCFSPPLPPVKIRLMLGEYDLAQGRLMHLGTPEMLAR